MSALTILSDEEQSYFDAIKDFAKKEITPHVTAMDEAQQVNKDIVKKLFEMGLMGIEVPQSLEGSEASFFTAILAVQAISQVDPSVGVMVDVQNTLVNNAFMRWGSDALGARALTPPKRLCPHRARCPGTHGAEAGGGCCLGQGSRARSKTALIESGRFL